MKLAWLFLGICAVIAVVVIGAGGIDDSRVNLSDSPWPPSKVEYVVGYCYDFIQDPRGYEPVFDDSSLNRGVIQSIRLSGEQQRELVTAVTTSIDYEDSSDCHYPHHAFVFFDSSDRPVGWVSVCLECGTYTFSSRRAPAYVPFEGLRELCLELGLPELEEPTGYTDLFRNTLDAGGSQEVVTWEEWLGIPPENPGDGE